MSKDNLSQDLKLVDDPAELPAFEAAQATTSAIKTTSHGKPGRCRRPHQAFSLEWAAGFADGEACIYVCKQTYTNPKRKQTYRLGFAITQNDLQVLEHFQQGLNITEPIYKVKRQLQHNRQIYTLNCSGKSALRVIATLQPYLVRKQLEAQSALDYWKLGHGGGHPGPLGWSPSVIAIRERFYQKLKALK